MTWKCLACAKAQSSGLVVVLVGVVVGFWVWFGAAGLDCQAHPTYPPI